MGMGAVIPLKKKLYSLLNIRLGRSPRELDIDGFNEGKRLGVNRLADRDEPRARSHRFEPG